MTRGATGAGVILGTAAYMAPEQARGLPVDKRADIWAFGVILFEMLSGHAAFAARSVPDTLAAVDADSVVRLYVREMATGEQRVVPGTEGRTVPVLVRRRRWIGYFSKREASLRKISAAGGAPITVCRAGDGKGGAWNRDGVILFTPDSASPIYRVTADGGEPKQVVASVAQAEYASGALLFDREGTLLAQAFDPGALELAGSPEPVATNVAGLSGASSSLFSVSAAGTLDIHRGALQQAVQLELRDRTGRLLERLGAAGAAFRDMEFSPEGGRVAFSRLDRQDIFLLDLTRRNELRFTLEPSEEVWPVWAPDGGSLFYGSNLKGPHDIYRKAVAGTGREDLVLDVPEAVVPGAVSPDGRALLYARYPPITQGLWSLDLASGRSERAVDRGVFQSRVASRRMDAGSSSSDSERVSARSSPRRFSAPAGSCRYRRTAERSPSGSRLAARSSISILSAAWSPCP